MISLEVKNQSLRIPPGDAAFRSDAAVEVARPVKLVSMQPHMHLRGKAMEIRASFPGGKADVLLSVPRYDFNWQTMYSLRESVLLPAGIKLESIAWFDNSGNNPHNPDPTKTVLWGEQTWDEMHIGFSRAGCGTRRGPGHFGQTKGIEMKRRTFLGSTIGGLVVYAGTGGLASIVTIGDGEISVASPSPNSESARYRKRRSQTRHALKCL